MDMIDPGLLNGTEFNGTWQEQNNNVIYQVCVFRPIGKPRYNVAVWPLNDWNIFDSLSSTTEPNSQKLDRKQDFNALFQVWVFQGDRKTNMATLICWNIFDFYFATA